MIKPTHAVLDGDIIVYRAAYWADKEGVDCLEDRIKEDIKQWIPKGCTEACVALSCAGAQNFRKQIWGPYKAHRALQAKPTCLHDAFDIISNIPGLCIIKETNLEADDLIGIATSSGQSIGVSIDKDLIGTPGWHWNPSKQLEPVLVTLEQADAYFLQQWVSGDSTDNIWGLWKCGPAKGKAMVKDKTFEEAVQAVWDAYVAEDWTKRPEDKTPILSHEGFAISQAWAVRILRNGDFNNQTGKIRLWMPPLKSPVTTVIDTNLIKTS